jgi:hypothetical protein
MMEIFLISMGLSSLFISTAFFYKILVETNLKKNIHGKSSRKEINHQPPQDELELSKRLEEFRNQRFARPIATNKKGNI